MAKVDVSYKARKPDLEPQARALAADLGLHLSPPNAEQDADLLLLVTPAGLELSARQGPAATPGSKPFHVELSHIDARSGPGRNRRQPIARAVALGRTNDPQPTVLDATAGWGEDAWLLAMLGCQVLAVERNAVVAALLEDGLRRLAGRQPVQAARLMVARGDAKSLDVLPWRLQHFLRPDVVYLDPMFDFGERGRRAKERRPLVLLRQLAGSDPDAVELLDWALTRARRRVVVKRPLHGPHLADRPPVASHKGKSLRWDVYTPIW